MKLFLITLGLSIGILAIYFVFMGVRLIFLKDGEFKGTCASQSPYLRNGDDSCGFCGKPLGSCENEPSQSEVEKVMAKFK